MDENSGNVETLRMREIVHSLSGMMRHRDLAVPVEEWQENVIRWVSDYLLLIIRPLYWWFSVIRRDIGQVVGGFCLFGVTWTEPLGCRMSKPKSETATELRDTYWFYKHNMFQVQWDRPLRLLFVTLVFVSNTQSVWHTFPACPVKIKGGSKDSLGGGDGSCYKCGQKGHWSNGMISIHWLNNSIYLMNFPCEQPVQMV